jgi:poly-gamma-glutamate synthesis protein (capsule biosynthesis protein)
LRQTAVGVTGTAVQYSPDAYDVLLTLGEGEPIAQWIYAAAAPFPTLADGLTLADLQMAWQNGSLLLTAEMVETLTAWWGAPESPPVTVAAEELVAALWRAQSSPADLALTILPFDQLHPRLKVLRVDGRAPVAMDFDPADYALTLKVNLAGEPAAITAVRDNWPGPAANWDREKISFIVMTGPAGMRRAVGDRMERYGLFYPVEETGPVLQMADIAHLSNENPFDSNCPTPDPFDSDNVCSPDHYIEMMTWAGVNVNELTGNHLNDRGPAALRHTLDLYDQHGIQTFGGGRNLEEARRPLLIEHNDNRLAFVGCNPVGPYMAWAREDYPGSLPCEDDYAVLEAQIHQLSDDGYLVIATLQYWEYYVYTVPVQQRRDFERLAAAGAISVSGSQGHHPQGFGFYDDNFIHYGLGNMLADQMFSLGTRQMFMNIHLVYDGRLLNIDLWTGINEDYARVRQTTPEERVELLTAVFTTSIWNEE